MLTAKAVGRFFRGLAGTGAAVMLAGVLAGGTQAKAQEKSAAATSSLTLPGNTLSLPSNTVICVDGIVGAPEASAVTKEAVLAVLAGANRWEVHDTCDSASVRLKGSVLVSNTEKSRGESEKTSHASGAIGGAATATAAAVGGAFLAISGSESLHSSEKGQHASVSLRLVDAKGKILWAGTWDSEGGKTRHAVPDAAERVTKSFLRAVPAK